MKTDPKITASYLVSYYPLHVGLGVGLFMLTLVGAGFFWHHSRSITGKNIELDEKNKLLVDTNKLLQETIDELHEASIQRNHYKYQAEIDSLSGVFNKQAIAGIARQALAEKMTGAFFIIDLDHFKEANDTCGHQYGDVIIRKFGASLKKLVRQNDAVGRFGGDEFIIIIPNITDPIAIANIAKRVNEIANQLDTCEGRTQLSASVGISLFPKHGFTYEAIFEAADNALYHVKKNGRNGYQIYHEPEN